MSVAISPESIVVVVVVVVVVVEIVVVIVVAISPESMFYAHII